MKRRLIVREEAEQELKAAHDWYEERRPGLGETLLEMFIERSNLIAERPELFAVIGSGVRTVQVRKFPYAIFYLAESESVEIIAVLHTSRDPDTWRLRV